jgi:membrane-bound lytic murein transglycosylase MltF
MNMIRILFVVVLMFWHCSFPVSASEQDDSLAFLEHAYEPWLGDLDGMVDRGFIRILTVRNPIYFSLNGVEERGLLHDMMRVYQKSLHKRLGKKARNLRVVIIPMPRDQLIPRLNTGRGDMILANLTITPARQKHVAFTHPTLENVREILVTGPAGKDIKSFDDVAEAGLTLRKTSSYFGHVAELNAWRKKSGQKPIPVRPAPEVFEDYDLLEMVNAGLLPAVIVDDHLAILWAKLMSNLKLHSDLTTNEGGQIAWALRKSSPELLAITNEILKVYNPKSKLAAQLNARYLGSSRWMKNSLSKKSLARYEDVIGIIKKYAAKYDFDWLMIAAQGYQESRLDQSARSPVGAIGIMQIMPATAADRAVNIPNIEEADPNVHAGVRYLRHLRRHYFDKPELTRLNQNLFAFAAYNAGPGNVNKARRRAEKMGLDRNQWFGHVETAMARAVSREPVIYVRHIYKYYIAYKSYLATKAAWETEKSKPKSSK